MSLVFIVNLQRLTRLAQTSWQRGLWWVCVMGFLYLGWREQRHWWPGEVAASELIPACRDSRWGFIDRLGREVIPLRYTYVTTFGDRGLAIAAVGDPKIRNMAEWQWGVINHRGEPVIPLEFDSISRAEDQLDKHNLWVSRDGKWGCFDWTGKQIVPFEWDDCTQHYPPSMEWVENDNFGYATVRRDNRWTVIDPEGRQHPIWSETQSTVASNGDWPVHQNGLWGLANRDGKLIAPCILEYQVISPFDEQGMAWIRDDLRYGWIDRSGKLVIPMIYSVYTKAWDKQGWLPAFFWGGKAGWIDRRGQIMLPFERQGCQSFDDAGMAPVFRDEKWGWIDRSGKLVIPLKWDNASPFDEHGVAFVFDKQRHETSWIDRSGRVVHTVSHYALKPKSDPTVDRWPPCFDSHGWLRLSNGQSPPAHEFVDRAGKAIPMPNYEYLPIEAGPLLIARKNGKCGVVDRRGNIQIPFEWDDCSPDGEFFRAKRGPEWCYLNRQGSRISPSGYTLFGETQDDPRSQQGILSRRCWMASRTEGTRLDRMQLWLWNALPPRLQWRFNSSRTAVIGDFEGRILWNSSWRPRDRFIACLALVGIFVGLIRGRRAAPQGDPCQPLDDRSISGRTVTIVISPTMDAPCTDSAA